MTTDKGFAPKRILHKVPCQFCGWELERMSPHKATCSECKAERQRARQAERAARLRMLKLGH